MGLVQLVVQCPILTVVKAINVPINDGIQAVDANPLGSDSGSPGGWLVSLPPAPRGKHARHGLLMVGLSHLIATHPQGHVKEVDVARWAAVSELCERLLRVAGVTTTLLSEESSSTTRTNIRQ